ncbi:MAG: hypothetical protein AAGA78_18370 [Pseudomonadota bacterium]
MLEGLLRTAESSWQLFTRHGRWVFVELVALGVAVDLVFLLWNPGVFGPILGFSADLNPLTASAFYPYLLASSLAFTCLIAHQITRIWLAETDGQAQPGHVMSLIRASLVPLLVIQAGIDAAFLISLLMLVLLGPVILALTTLTIPTVVIEGRGWAGFARNLNLVSGMWGRLALLWACLLLPTMIGSAIIHDWAVARMGEVSEGVAALSFATLTDLPSTLMNAAAVCIILAVYREATQAEAGPDPSDVFR